jgi:hypothetical protein
MCYKLWVLILFKGKHMNSSDKFTEFLSSLNESVSKESDKDLIKAVLEAYSLLEGPYVWNNKAKAPETRRNRSAAPQQSAEEIADNNADLKRRQKAANQAGGRLQGVQTQLLKAAKVAPMEIEEFIKSDELRAAIKAGKADLDSKFGTDTGKRSIKDRLKGAVRGFTEAESGVSNNNELNVQFLRNLLTQFEKHRNETIDFNNLNEFDDALLDKMDDLYNYMQNMDSNIVEP